MMKKIFYIIFAFIFLNSANVQAQTTVTWAGIVDGSAVVAPVNAAFTPVNVTKGANLSAAAVYGVDGYGTAGSGGNAGWNQASLANAVTLNVYVEYALTLSCATNYCISNISFTTKTSAGTINAESDIRYSTDNWTSYTSLGAIPTNPVSTTAQAQSITPATCIMVDPGQTIKIRIYGYGIGAQANKLYLLNFILTGTANAFTACGGGLSGTIDVGEGEAYTSLTRACGLFEAINTCGLSGNLTVNIVSNTLEDGTNALNQWAGVNTLTIQPGDAINYTLTGDVANYLIHLNGADRVTIDGRFPAGTGSGQYLTFRNENVQYSLILVDNTASDNNIQYINCASGFNGISINTVASSNNTIINCDVFDFINVGIAVIGGTSTIVEKNNIYSSFDLTSDMTTYGITTLIGIALQDCRTSMIVRKNLIHDLQTTKAIKGIYYVGASGISQTVSLENNMIILSNSRGTNNNFGIDYYGYAANSMDIYFNSIYLGGTGSGITCGIAKRDAATTFNCKNNIVYNNSASTAGNQYAFYFPALGYPTVTTCDNNILYSPTATYGKIGYWNATVCASLGPCGTAGTWMAVSGGCVTGKDINSLNQDPKYINNISDLHIQPTFFQNGVAAGGITTDIDDQTRSVPNIGCDEVCTAGGGSAYGVYAADGVATVTDCKIVASSTATDCGASSCKVCTPTDDAYANVEIDNYPVITVENIQCLNSDMDFTSSTPVPTWTDFGVNPLIAPPSNANPLNNQQYTATTGRRTITATGTQTTQNFKLQEDFETGGAGWTVLKNSGSFWATLNNPAYAFTGSNSKYCLYKRKEPEDSWLFFPGLTLTNGTTYTIRFWQRVASSFYPEKMKLTVGTVATIAGQTTTLLDLGTVTNEQYTVRTATFVAGAGPTYYFAFQSYSAKNMFALMVDSVSVYSTSTSTPTLPYTDFINITMDKPAAGTILGAPVGNGCPNTYPYSSSVAGTPGFTYAWSYTTTGGSANIVSPTASTTDITFTNLTGSNQDFTLKLNVTSGCCGPLPQVTRVITIYPGPAAPTVSGTPYSKCTGGSVTLAVTAPDPVVGYSYDWFDAATGGTLLGSGDSYIVSSVISGVTNYYAQATNSSGCPGPRTTVVVNGTDSPPTTNSPQSRCNPGGIPLTITNPVAGATYNWYSDAGCTSLLQSDVGLTYDVNVPTTPSSVNVYIKVAAPGCGASTATTATGTTTGTLVTSTTWKGTTSTDWFDGNNWSDCVPSELVNAIFPSVLPSGGNECAITFANASAAGYTEARAKNVLFATGRTITFGDSKATLRVYGDWIQQGTLVNASQGTIIMSGSAAQTITTSAANGAFNNLEINNSYGTAPQISLNTGTGHGDQVFSATPGTTTNNSCGTSGITSTIAVSDPGTTLNMSLVSVTVTIAHTDDQDIDLYLITPNGKTLELTSDNGGAGNNYTTTVFTDNSATNITAGAAPFTGNFKPEGTIGTSCSVTTNIATFSAISSTPLNPNGNWTLRLIDDLGGGSGTATLTSWSITFPDWPTAVTGSNIVIAADGQMTLTDGIISTAGAREVQIINPAGTSLVGGSSDSYIAGTLRRYVNATGSYNFPLGTASNYEYSNITLNASVGIGNITGSFTNPITYTGPDPTIVVSGVTETIDTYLNSGFWTFTPNALTSINYDITLTSRGHANGGTVAGQHTIVKRTTAGPGAWTTFAGSHNNATQSGSGSSPVTAKLTAMTSFSDFAIGRKSSDPTALFVDLLFFNVICENIFTHCQWSTASETNNDYFVIERSFDAEIWEFVAQIKGAGNSNEIKNYEYFDKSTIKGLTYYRLIQHDFDGNEIVYNTVNVNCELKGDFYNIIIYPNPASSEINLLLNSTILDEGKIYIYNDIGMCIFSQNISIGNETSKIKIDISKFSVGSYYIQCVFEKHNPAEFKFVHNN